MNVDLGSDDAVDGRGLYANFSKWVRDNNLNIHEAIGDAERKLNLHRETLFRLDPLEKQLNTNSDKLQQCDDIIKKQIK